PARPLVASVTSLPPTRPSPRSTPFPYTTLFRSLRRRGRAEPDFPSYQLTFKIPVMGFVTAELSQKREGLNCLLRALKRMLVAYSGGVDSAFLAYAAHEVLGDDMLAVIADSPSLARTHLADAGAFARADHRPLQIVATAELDRPEYARNDATRC